MSVTKKPTKEQIAKALRYSDQHAVRNAILLYLASPECDAGMKLVLRTHLNNEKLLDRHRKFLPDQNKTETPQSNPDRMHPDLIVLQDSPTMPAPMQSSDAGQAWVWGEYFMTLQTTPPIVAHAMADLAGSASPPASPMEYPYAMTIFYNKSKNPHGPSSRPVLCLALERANYSALSALLGVEGSKAIKSGQSDAPLMLGMFSAKGHANLGAFEGAVSPSSAQECFFEIVRSELHLEGDPVSIGSIMDVYGHPNTGWPAAPESTAAKKGCLGILTVMMCVLIAIIYYLVL